ncbi:MAG TPA: helix-hairpin-helix domain-containing protein [Oceanobacillus sp.]|nr:helix-hairpin-helix domain-containing protein [Oceanobacillus sp.]
MARLVYFLLGLLVGRWLSDLMREWAETPTVDEPTPSPRPALAVPNKSAAQESAAEPDDLTQITGLGATAAKALNDIGIRTFAQLAAQSEDELVQRLPTRVATRVRRDKWIEQAKKLSAR